MEKEVNRSERRFKMSFKDLSKNKKLMFGIPLSILLLGFVVALASSFHQTPVDLNVNEARSSADIPFSLSCLSGQTVSINLTIQNDANVDLKAGLTWTEDVNDGNVTYTTDIDRIVDLPADELTIIPISMTCDETTDSGFVKGTIDYYKTK